MKLQTEAEKLRLAFVIAGLAQGLAGDALANYVIDRTEEWIGADFLRVFFTPFVKLETRK